MTNFLNLTEGIFTGTLMIPLQGDGGPSIKNGVVRTQRENKTIVLRAESQWLSKPSAESFLDMLQSGEFAKAPRTSQSEKTMLIDFSIPVSEERPVGARSAMEQDDGTISERWSSSSAKFGHDDVIYVGEKTTYEDADGEEHVTSKPFILTSVGEWTTASKATEEDFDAAKAALSKYFGQTFEDDAVQVSDQPF